MTDEERRQKYDELLELPEEVDNARSAALERAHGLRKFEIENYWKRATYFWGFQLVAFGALALVAKDGRFQPSLVLVVAAIGAVTAFTGGLTARGSKFWQQNWERHVDLLERPVEGKLMEIVFLKAKRPTFSVSRVNERLLDVFCAAWLIAFLVAVLVLIEPKLVRLSATCAAAAQIGLTTIGLGAALYWIGRKSSRSGLKGRLYDYDTLDER